MRRMQKRGISGPDELLMGSYFGKRKYLLTPAIDRGMYSLAAIQQHKRESTSEFCIPPNFPGSCEDIPR